MTAQEFAEWRAFFEVEKLALGEGRKCSAVQVVATLRAGGVQRPDHRGWSVSDFAPVDVWKPYQATVPVVTGVKKMSDAARMRAFMGSGANG